MKAFQALKKTSIVSGALLASLATSQAKVTFYIKQVQEGAGGEGGLSTDVYVEDAELLKENKSSTGIHTALMEIGQYGSTFYFYVQGIDDPDGAPVLLDQKFVGQYVSTADVEITTADPYVPARTRADQPFTVNVTTANTQWTTAVAAGTAPELTWDPMNVLVDHTYEKQSINGALISNGIVDLDKTEGTNDTTLTLVAGNGSSYTTYTSLPASADPDEASVPYASISSIMGEETVVVQAQSDTDSNGNPIYRQVGSGTIQVWPIAQGKVIGLVENQKITQAMPDVTVQLYHLYPNSTTYVEIIEGPPSLDGGVVPVYTSQSLVYNSDTPKGTEAAPETIVITNWDNYIKQNGQYTIQVVTKTPFNDGNPERLLAVTFTVDRTVTIKGGVITSE